MEFPIKELPAGEFPVGLREIPQPPQQLNYRGQLPPSDLKLLSIVGSRKYTTYGKQVVEELVAGLASHPVGIISGLALGIDSLAHEAALANHLYTLAIPGGGLSDQSLYPASHRQLAFRILESNGGLLSEFEPTFKATKWSFPQRNRLVAGISQATLLVEAGEKSGTLITARLTADYNRELLVVPGSIFSKNSLGTHQFLKLGATPVTTSQDILEILNISDNTPPATIPILLSPAEQSVIDQLNEPTHRDELIRKINLQTHEASQLLMMMELAGHIKSEQNIYRSCR
ncbi:DNA-protecting protein DprA [Candidatus Nomurabacteria bacterium]|nr:DNA-protecting protein DprA [Candidatus Nomurabacteria bacterium]